MTFNRSMQLAGEGRLTGAVERNGRIDFFIDTEGAIIRRTMRRGSRGIVTDGIVSYAEDYTETARAAFSLMGNELEVNPLASG